MTDPTLEAAVSNLDLDSTEPETAAEGNVVEEGTMRIGRRCYVGNLAWRTSWQDLKDKFREVGVVVYANVSKDDTGRPKGWGIVEFETPEEAVDAVNTLNGVELEGRPMLVREDREDRDVKAFNRDHGGASRPNRPRRERKGRGGRGRGESNQATRDEGDRGDYGGDNGGEAEATSRQPRDRPPRREPAVDKSSGLQIVVQGLPWAFTQELLQPMFESHGAVEECEVVYGRDGRSRGYGTVRYETSEEAQEAIQQLHGSELEGRMLTVRLDRYA